MGPPQLFVGGRGRVMCLHQVQQPALKQAVADH
jgi:hypothetical protein